MIRTFIVTIDDSLRNAEQDIDELEMKWGAEEVKHTCHTCKHYLPGEYDGSCGSYICKNNSGWEDKEQEDCDIFDEITDDESDGEVYEKIKEIIDKAKEQEE